MGHTRGRPHHHNINQEIIMFNDITNIVRSNQNAVMFRIGNGCASSAIYSIVDVKTQKTIKVGTRDACKAYWNRHLKNSRQFVTPNGSNHRFMGA
jgi:hypothetical protein